MDAIFIMREMQEGYQKPTTSCTSVLLSWKKLLIVPRKVMEWVMRKRGSSEVRVWAVISLYDGAKTRVTVRPAYLEEIGEKLVYIKDLCCAAIVCNMSRISKFASLE